MKFTPVGDVPLADIFEGLENLKQNGAISGYTVHQATLEQIFLTLTDNQKVND